MAAGSLVSQLMNRHGRVAEARQSWRTLDAGAGEQTFQLDFPAKGGPQSCLVEVYQGRVATRMAMQVHFLNWNVLDTVVILEEGNFPHPRCTLCKMLVPWRALNSRHPSTE